MNAAGETAYQKLRAAVNADTAPCLSKMDGMNLANFAADGLLTDVTKVAAPYKSKYIPAAWNAVSPGGTTFGIPIGFLAGVHRLPGGPVREVRPQGAEDLGRN